MSTYTARVERDGRFWLVHVPAIDRTTQARNLREVEPMAVEMIALMQDIAPSDVELTVELVLEESVQRHLENVSRLRDVSQRANAEAAAEARAAARELAEAGLPVRDIGIALGVSHQRAHQLIKA